MDLPEISDRLEIGEVLVRYTRAIDTGDWDALDTVFTADAAIDYTESGGIAGAYPEVKAWLAEVLPAFFPLRLHTLGQVDTRLDGDTAEITAYFHNPMPMADGHGGETIVEFGGLYEHRLVRTPEGWRSRQLHERIIWKRVGDWVWLGPLPPRQWGEQTTRGDDMTDPDREQSARKAHPVLTGLLALAAVALSVGLVLGGVALAATDMLGMGEGDTANDRASGGQSMYLPKPERTRDANDPLITLAPDDQAPGDLPSAPDSTSESPKNPISLSVTQSEVGVMDRVDLTGTYPGGEGAILQVQRFENGTWSDFAVTIPVSNESFSTYIQSSQMGQNRFRVVDNNGGGASNEIRFTIR